MKRKTRKAGKLSRSATTGFAAFDRRGKLLAANAEFFAGPDHDPVKWVGSSMDTVVGALLENLTRVDGRPVKSSKRFVQSLVKRWSDIANAPFEASTRFAAWKLLTSHSNPEGGITLVCVDVTSVRQTQMQSAGNEEIQRQITHAHPLPVWMTDEETGEILYESIEASKVLGRDWDESKPQYIGDHYVDQEDRERVKEHLQKHGILRDHVVRFKKMDGTRLWISANVRPGVFRGRKVLIAGIVDVTERKEREDQVRFMLAGHPLPVAMNEVESGRLVMESPAYARLIGRDPEAAGQINISGNYVRSADRTRLIAKLRQTKRVDNFEALWQRQGGSRFWVRLNARLVEYDGAEVILAGVLDVTEQKMRENELTKARELLADAIESISEGFALYDEDARLVLCNANYVRLNEAVSDIVKPGMLWSELLRLSIERGVYSSPIAEEVDGVEKAALQAAEFRRELEHQYADGRWYSISTHPTKMGGFVVTKRDISARKQVETARREVDEVVRQVVDACPAALEMRKIADGAFLYRSPAAVELLGDRNDLKSAYVNPQDQIDLHLYLKEFGEVLDRRIQLTNATGDPFWASVSARYIEFRGDLVVVSTISDLTGRVKAERDLERANELLSDAIESLAEGFALFDKNRRLVMCNSRYLDMNEPTKELLRAGVKWDDILAAGVDRGQFPDALNRSKDWIKERMGGILGHERAYEFQQSDGRWYSALSSPTREGGFVVTRVDITKRIQMESAQRDADKLVRQVLEASPVMILMNEFESGEIIYRSPATKSLFGEPESALSFYADPADRKTYLQHLRRHGSVDNFKYLARRSSNETFWASVSGRVIEFQGRRVIVSHTRDLSEQLAIEKELERQREIVHQSEKMSALGELLAGVAHELNNPLSVVVGQTLLLKETAETPAVRTRAEKIATAADRCSRIVRTFLAMARQKPARTESISINEVLESALEVTGYAIRSSDIDLSLRLAKDLPAVWGDPDQLSQVFSNLLINAQQVLTGFEGRRKITVTTRHDRNAGSVIVKIADSGPGMSEDIRSRIFEPFFTTKEVGSGTGIGLAFCHRIIAAHEGAIRAQSDPGKGASFFIRLPVPDKSAMAVSANTKPSGTGISVNVLVVEDEQDVAGLMAEILRRDGHIVTCVENGKAALREVSRQHFDVVLSDLNMPDFDGGSLFDVLSSDYPHIVEHTAFVTGDTMGRKARATLERSGRPYLEKPIRPGELRELVAQLAAVD